MSTSRPGYFLNPYTKQLQFYGTYPKPGFRASADKSRIIIDASANRPAFFIIGGDLFTSTSDLTCILAVSGAGGLVSSVTSNAIYYLYAINNGGSLALIADVRSPHSADGNNGPRGFSPWTYVGAFATNSSSQADPFRSFGGRYQTMDHGVAGGTSVNHTGTTNDTKKTLILPTTIKFLSGVLRVSGGTIGQTGRITGGTAFSGTYYWVLDSATASVTQGFFTFPMEDPPNVYVDIGNAAQTLRFWPVGWIEDPSEWL